MRKNNRWVNRELLSAVHENDLSEFLSSIGVLNDIKAAKLFCGECGVMITLDNFGAALPENGKIVIFCDRLECISQVENNMGKKNE